MYARVAFPIPYDEFFTYRIPPELDQLAEPGMIITAPLGNKPAAGVILEIVESPDIPGAGIKEISSIIDPDLSIPADLLELVKLTARRYATTPGMVLKSALPPGSLQRRKLYLYPGKRPLPPSSPPEALELVARVAKSPGRLSYNDLGSSRGKSRDTADRLIKAGILALSPFKIQSRAGTKRKWVKAVVDRIPDNFRQGTRTRALLELLIESGGGRSLAGLADLGFSASSAGVLQRKGLVEFEFRDREIGDIGGMKSLPRENVVELTLWQRAILGSVESSLDQNRFKGFLLYGVTSSGKTQVYLEAARHAISKGKSVLVMAPEISLTPQIVVRFERALGISPLVWHSRLTPSERAIVFKQARRGEIRLIIGARSSIFSPLKNLGLIIVDEEQDGSYKQVDPAPRYNARDLALERGRLVGATVLMGSATPSAESYHAAMEGKLELHSLPQRVAGKRPPKIEIISTAVPKPDEAKSKPVFPPGFWPVSQKLFTELSIRMKNKEQVIILLNRRGYSSSVVCFQCGWLGKCPDCEVGWAYHKTRNMMVCHYCGNEKAGLSICPQCGSARLSFRGAGTERLEETLKDLFPGAKTRRLDSDAVGGKWESRDILDEFGKGKIDILLGTQMVAKGHHFPAVGFVGVIGADVGLSLPDFRASERVLQLLTQAAGRAGRSSRKSDPGLVMVQTFAPKTPLFEYLQKDDYVGFLQDEMLSRKTLNYPPYCRLILIEVSSPLSSKAAGGAVRIKNEIAAIHTDTSLEILGPARSPVFKRGKNYRYQIMLKIPSDGEFGGIIETINHIARDARGFSVRVDVDPVSFI